MAFWQDIGSKVTQKTVELQQKAKGLSEKSRLTVQIGEEQKRITECYQEIGRIYVSMYGNSPGPQFAGPVHAIQEAQRNIEECRRQIQELTGTIICPQCGSEIPADAFFCTSCGARTGPAAAGDGSTCASCGARLEPGERFCTNCGTPVLSAAAAAEHCPHCGMELAPGAAFCNQCGHSIRTSARGENLDEM